MQIKYIVAALGFAAAAAHAAQIVPPSTVGGSDLLLNVWEQADPNGKPDQSFTLDLGQTLTGFVNAQGTYAAAGTTTLATLLSSDSLWQSFLASSDVPALQWAVVASGNKVPKLAGILATIAPTDNANVSTNQSVIVANNQLVATIAALNSAGVVSGNALEQVNAAPSNAYFQTYALNTFNTSQWNNSSAIGSTMGVGTANNVGGFTSLPDAVAVLPGAFTFAQTGSSYVLTYSVAAVPEATGFGMVLAGFGVMGFLGLRRRQA